MDLNNSLWGFSKPQGFLYSKNHQTGIQNNKITLSLSSLDGITDLAILSPKIYLLQLSNLLSIDLYKHTTKKHDLRLSSYQGIISHCNHIIIIGANSLKFDPKSKLCRKIDLQINNFDVITKCSHKNNIFLLLYSFDQSANTFLYKYSYDINKTTTIPLKYRIPIIAYSYSIIKDNSIYIFGGRYEFG